MLRYRLITGPLLIIALLAIVLLDDRLDNVRVGADWQWLFQIKANPDQLPKGIALFVLAMVIMPLATGELCSIFRANNIRTSRWLAALAAMLGLALSYCIPMGAESIHAIAILSTGVVLVFITALFVFSRHQNIEGVVAAAGAVVFTMVYLGLMLGFLLALRREHSAWWIVGVVAITKSCDTGAYFTGRAIGRTKLIPWLSPGKTWEGLIGGLITSTAIGVLLAWASDLLPQPGDHVPLWVGALCGFTFGAVGQLGDLTMSLLKRGAGLKDSSTILPGLGGVLDVLDSPMLVAPVAYWMLTLAV